MLLWQEYKELTPNGFRYSHFCDFYRQWHKRLDISMRQLHIGGEKLFVDCCGQTLPIVNISTEEICEFQVFVAVLGASNYTYAEAAKTQALPDWTGSHIRTFAFIKAVPKVVTPDNLWLRTSSAQLPFICLGAFQ